jgi:RimJ/RimL family protein N-acetyltransferase
VSSHEWDPASTEDPPLQTERLTLAPLRVQDADEMVEVLADEQLYAFIGGTPPTLEELRARYRQLVTGHSADGSEDWRNWVVRLRADGAAVGTVQATIVDAGHRADIAWVIGIPWQGQGLATESARAMVAWLEARGVSTITAHVHPEHAASARVAERAGLAPTTTIEDGELIWTRGRSSSETGIG